MSQPSIKNLIRKRGQIKGRMTNFKEFISKLEASQTHDHVGENELSDSEILQLESRTNTIQETLQQFEAVNAEIIELDTDDCVEQRYAEFNDFENELHDIVAKARCMLNKARISKGFKLERADSSSSGSISSIHANNVSENVNDLQITNASSIVKLPVLKIQTFDGKPENFPSFYESFKSLVHNNSQLDDMSKYLYLKSCLSPEPSKVIEHLDVVSSNYQVALTLLEKRYKNKKLLIHNHVKGIVEFPKIQKESASNLRALSDSLQAHLRALESLGEPTSSWYSIIQYLIVEKFDYHSKREWEIDSSKVEVVDISFLLEFLEKRCALLEKIERPAIQSSSIGSSPKRFKNKTPHVTCLSSHDQEVACSICKNNHPVFRCKLFMEMNEDERMNHVNKHKLCTNCLRSGHDLKACKSGHCRKCSNFHSTFLHNHFSKRTNDVKTQPFDNQSSLSTVVVDSREKGSDNANATLATASSLPVEVGTKGSYHILPTAVVIIYDFRGQPHRCTALLDSGSQQSYMTVSLCNKLKLPTLSENIPVSGINEAKTKVSQSTCARIKSIHSDFDFTLSFLLLQNITNRLPPVSINANTEIFPKDIPLANPRFHEGTRIDILLGVEIFWKLLAVDQPYIDSFPLIYNTHLGYVISGHCSSTANDSETICGLTVLDLSKQMQQFWEIENIASSKRFSPEELECETHFVANTRRDPHGRFIVTIPLNSSPEVLGESKQGASKQFLSLERRLQRNQKLKSMYDDFMSEYESLGHMIEVNQDIPPDSTEFYIPHHGIYKEDSLTTKLRVVFNSSAPSSSGVSFNDIQLNGPILQDDLFAILLRFRRFQYVLSSDCSKMYRSVWITPSQRPLQRIFWRTDPSLPLKVYELCTVTYGERSSSFLAIRCLFELANIFEERHPDISAIIRKDMYCDDLLTSCKTVEDGIHICETISQILQSGGFTLRKWNSNNPDLLKSVHQTDISNNILDFGPNQNSKTLGLLYNSYSDEFLYKIRDFPLNKPPCKRTVLSFISMIFDPMGFLTPSTIFAKSFIQQLWMLQIGWDDPLPPELESQWYQYCHELSKINDIHIPRQVICNNPTLLEIHGFSDSSKKSYGACVYIRSRDCSNKMHVHLLCSKTKVAPLKTITIPRLELCGALMLVKLVDKVKRSLDVHVDNVHYWTDSKIVLAWIGTSPHMLDTFVSNRVSQIQDLSNTASWNYISSAENPADILSRGMNPPNLINSSLWWYGPPMLSQCSSLWPNSTEVKLPESSKICPTAALAACEDGNLFPFERFSSLLRTKRVMAYCLRFIKNCRVPQNERCFGQLSSDELHFAFMRLSRISQLASFPREMKALFDGNAIDKRSRLQSLTPFLDSTYNILRVRGRLLHSDFDYDKRHPIILCSKHPFTKLLFKQLHEQLLHAGPQLLLSSIRDRFWPLGGRNLSKAIVRSCVKCFRVRPVGISNLLGHLPPDRVRPSYPFSIVGTDYCGPFLIKDREGRGFRSTKCYICLFICFSTRAVHLEPVTDLTSEAFILCLRSFASRRGMPKKFYSDNGRTYCGAKSELNELAQFLLKNKDNLESEFANQNFDWKFLPPYSPNMAGIWEAGIKSAKFHLKRVMGNALLTFRQFYSVLVQIEGILNSRPLSPLSSDPNDCLPLTPSHFLIGRPITSVPDPDVTHIKENRLSLYQRLQQIVQNFWVRWSKEYISELQQRTKWKQQQKNVKVGTVVLIKEDNLPPSSWKLGLIIGLHPGHDGIVRVVSVRTERGVTRRALPKICPLPID